jgi:hypothetical protein
MTGLGERSNMGEDTCPLHRWKVMHVASYPSSWHGRFSSFGMLPKGGPSEDCPIGQNGYSEMALADTPSCVNMNARRLSIKVPRVTSPTLSKQGGPSRQFLRAITMLAHMLHPLGEMA